MDVEIQASSLARKRFATSLSIGSDRRHEPVRLFEILIEAEVGNKVMLLTAGEVDWIWVGGDFGMDSTFFSKLCLLR